MNKLVKFGCAAAFLAVAVPAFAEEEEASEGAIGWTPIAVGIASPVQLPWGLATWDVFGVDFNLLYSDAPKMYGIGCGFAAMTVRDDLKGIQFGGLCNWNSKDVYGIRTTLGANITHGESYGIDMGSFAYRTAEMWGVDVNFIGSYGSRFSGVGLSGIVNLDMEQSYGCTVAIGGNMAKVAYGAQIAGVFNFTEELHGAQISLVNFARECPWGFQIGLVNVILDNKLKVLPILNAYF